MLSNGYILILVWVGVIGALAAMAPEWIYRTEFVSGERVRRVTPLFAVVAVLPLVIWAGFRGNVGDTGSYIQAFKDMPTSLSGISSYIESQEKDQGFYFVSAVIKCIIGNQDTIYFIIVAAVQCILLFKIYRKYSSAFAVSFFLFIASTDYISWVFNGMRQFTAVTITVACFPWILQKKYVKAIIVILIASLFHQSALLVLPFVFIVQGKAWNKKTLFFIVAVVIAVVFADRFTDILDNMTPSKKRLVLAGVELYKRCNMQRNKQMSIRQGKDVYELMVPIIGDNRTEEVWVIFLSQSNKIIRKMRVAFGGYTSCLIDVRVILKEALACEAVSLILCHNHPSGNRLPSTDDDRMTQRINEASKIIGLRLIDHVIICRDSYYSYIEEGRI